MPINVAVAEDPARRNSGAPIVFVIVIGCILGLVTVFAEPIFEFIGIDLSGNLHNPRLAAYRLGLDSQTVWVAEQRTSDSDPGHPVDTTHLKPIEPPEIPATTPQEPVRELAIDALAQALQRQADFVREYRNQLEEAQNTLLDKSVELARTQTERQALANSINELKKRGAEPSIATAPTVMPRLSNADIAACDANGWQPCSLRSYTCCKPVLVADGTTRAVAETRLVTVPAPCYSTPQVTVTFYGPPVCW